MSDIEGSLIVIEGTDGTGKTVQSNLLYNRLIKLNIPAYITTEPTSRPVGKLIRSEYLSGNTPMDPMVGAMLYATDRLDHILNEEDGILKKVQNRINVISDRYYISSLAYQGSLVPTEFVINANRYIMNTLRPTMTIFLSLNPDLTMKRITARGMKTEIFETLEYQTKIYAAYSNVINILKSEGEYIQVIDAAGTIEEISETIWNLTKPLFYRDNQLKAGDNSANDNRRTRQ